MSYLFCVVSLLFPLAYGNTTVSDSWLSELAKPEKCCQTTISLMLEMGNAIRSLNRKLDGMTASQENCERQLELQSQKLKEIVEIITMTPQDCHDIGASGRNISGIYRIYIGTILNRLAADVFCDLKSSNSSWLVFQRRQDGSEVFERTWTEYADGFGDPMGEFWLGNNALYLLTSTRNYKLRVEMEDFDGQKRFAEYSKFSIAPPSDNYRLTVSGYSGDAGDSLSSASGYQFSTKDADHDIWSSSCALVFHGAWWYNQCHESNLNGLYLRGTHASFADGIEWKSFRGFNYSLKRTEMKIALIN